MKNGSDLRITGAGPNVCYDLLRVEPQLHAKFQLLSHNGKGVYRKHIHIHTHNATIRKFH